MSVIGAARLLFSVEGTQQVRAANAEVAQSFEQTGRVASREFERMTAGQLKVVNAQRRYQDAVRRSGAESTSALRALQNLRLAEERLASQTSRTSSEVRHSGSAFRSFGHDVERAGLGITVGSRAIHGLRTAIAFSAPALGGFAIAGVIRASRDAALEQQAALNQLQVALKDAGVAQSAYTGTVRDSLEAQKQLGFDEESSARSFALAVRATKDVTAAQRLQSIASDVARGRNMDLVAATQLLVRVQAGQVGSLRRLGIEVAKGTSGTKALAEVQRQYAGSAAAYARSAEGAQARFNIAIHTTEETIGRALLPTITNLNSRLAKWLDNSKNQERIQRDVNEAVRVGGAVVHDISAAFHGVSTVVRPLNALLGGTQHTVRALGAALLALKLRSWAGSMGLLGAQTRVAGAAAATSAGEFNALAAAEGRAAAEGDAAAASAGRATGALRAFGAAFGVVIAGQFVAQAGQGLSKWLGAHVGHGLGDTPLPPGVSFDDLTTAKKHYDAGTLTAKDQAVLRAVGVSPADIRAHSPVDTSLSATSGAGPHGAAGLDVGTAGNRRHRTSLQGLFNLAALRLAQAGSNTTLQDKALNDELAIVNRQIAAEKNLQKKTDLINQRNGIVAQLQSNADARQQQIDAGIQKAKETHAKKREAALKKKLAAEKALNAKIKRLYQEDIAGSTSNANTALKDRSEYLNKKYGLASSTAAATAKIAAKTFPGPNAALARELQDAVAGLAQYAPNINVHQYFPHPPTDDGSREAIYAKHALASAFD